MQAGNHDASELLIKAMKEEVLQWCSLLDFNSAAASIVGAIRERANAHQGRGTKTSKKKGAKDPSRALSSHGRRINSAAEHSRKRAMGSIHERKYTASHGGKSASSKEDDIKRLRAALKRNNQQQPRKTSKSSKTNAPKLTANMAESHLTYEEDQMLKRRMKRREDNIQMVEQKLRSNLVSQMYVPIQTNLSAASTETETSRFVSSGTTYLHTRM